MRIRPLFDRIVVTIEGKEDDFSKGGILIIDRKDDKDKQVVGTVYAAGPGKVLPDGELQATEVKVGDKILFTKGSAQLIKLDDQDYYFIKEEDIFGVL